MGAPVPHHGLIFIVSEVGVSLSFSERPGPTERGSGSREFLEVLPLDSSAASLYLWRVFFVAFGGEAGSTLDIGNGKGKQQ